MLMPTNWGKNHLRLQAMSGASMNLDNANETDVREVIVRPFLHELGYELGTENDILTERRLSYDKIVLGRRKKSDPPLAGRADYILSVTGYAR